MLRGCNPASAGLDDIPSVAPAIDRYGRIALCGIVEVATRTIRMPRARW
jgi:hypothetical protein